MTEKFGSTWGVWDLHVHTPESALNNNFPGNFDDYIATLLSKALDNNIRAIGITDYYCIEGYKRILEYFKNKLEKISALRDSSDRILFNSKQLKRISQIMIFPNIEFRLNKFFAENKKLNFHVIFSDELDIHVIEEHFLHDINFPFCGTPNNTTDRRKLKLSNIDDLGNKLLQEDESFNGMSAKKVGMMNVCVDEEEIIRILAEDGRFKDKYLLVLPADEDLSKARWDGQDHQTRKLLIQKVHCLFGSNPNTIKWGLGYKSPSPADFCHEFGSIKPCLWGSDAHSEDKLFNPDHNRFCWIKAERSFEGLLQALKEPENRIYIGHKPDTIDRIEKSPQSFIKSLSITLKTPDNCQDKWFKDVPEMFFNPELTAIIGNKGQGKSAIADFLAVSGDAQITDYFSFLKPEKFLKHPDAKLYSVFNKDYSGARYNSRAINSTDPTSPIERVRYLPQSYIESICADVDDSTIEKTIQDIVFSYVDVSDKMGSNSYNEFVNNIIRQFENEEQDLFSQIDKDVDKLIDLEVKTEPRHKKSIEDTLSSLRIQLSNLTAPLEVQKPNNEDDGETKTLNEIEKIETLVNIIKLFLEKIINKISFCKIEKASLSSLISDIESFKRKYDDIINKHKDLLENHGLHSDEIIKLSINKAKIEERLTEFDNYINKANSTREIISLALIELNNQTKEKKEEISELQRNYRDHLESKKIYDQNFLELNTKIKDNELYLAYLTDDLSNDIETERQKILKLTKDLLRIKFRIIEDEKRLFHPIKNTINEISREIPEITKYALNFDVKLIVNPKTTECILESFISMGNKGTFCGRENAFKVLTDLFYSKPINDIDTVIMIINNMIDAIYHDHREMNGKTIDVISSQFKKEFNQSKQYEFYKYLFKCEFLTTLTEITSDDKSIETLSPGEKGAVLLVLFLLLDRSTIPLIIDQPEENLDNQSVYEILRPFIMKAKKRRQTIIVTHNPNIAVACDAEQIICVRIDKLKENQFSFTSGGIENKDINKTVVDILEGTVPAFDNRKNKYHELSKR